MVDTIDGLTPDERRIGLGRDVYAYETPKWVCSNRMSLPDGSCECGHGPHVRVGDTISCDECIKQTLGGHGQIDKDGVCQDCGYPLRAGVACKKKKKWKRSNYVAAPAFFALNQACCTVNRAFGGFGCYLVGSSLHRRDYRDVDVRCILEDVEFDRMFRVDTKDADSGRGGWLNPLWSLMCTSISLWLSQQTGLQVDFQIQRQTQANEQHDGPRHALGIFMDYPGERPSDLSTT